MRRRSVLRPVVLLAACLVCTGCLLAYKHGGGPDRIDDDKVKTIVRGSTPRAQVLDWFGPPDSVLRPSAAKSEAGATAAFEMFEARGRPLAGRCVYAYETTEASQVGGVVLLASASSQSTSRHRLWILVNDSTGFVEDFVDRED